MWDREAKKRLGYKHPKTRVWTDADGKVIREVLHGADWDKRKLELWERCGGRCEQIKHHWALRCRNDAHDPDHIIERGNAQRNDMLSNLQGLCRRHHNEKHADRNPRWTKRSAA